MSNATSNASEIAPTLAATAAVAPVLEETTRDQVAWRNVADGEEEARVGNRLVFYFFTADWCGPCVTMKNELFSDPGIAAAIQENFVPIEVLDRTREEGENIEDVARIQMRFLVSAFPTLVVARPDSGYGVTEAGLVSEQGLRKFLREGPLELERLERASLSR